MTRSSLYVAIVAAAVAATPFQLRGQESSVPLRVESYRSPTGLVEVIGLRRWNLSMLRDSVRVRVRGLDLQDAACMVVLRDSLHFQDASVNVMSFAAEEGAPVERFTLIELVEPSDTARVRWRGALADSFRVLRPGYAPLVMGATDSTGFFDNRRILFPLQFAADPEYRQAALAGVPAVPRAAAQADADRLAAFLANHRADADWRTAIGVLAHDGDYVNRVSAAVVLANFADRDSTWLSLVEALRDGNQPVRMTALTTLQSFKPRAVNWAAAVPTLRALLGGTDAQASDAVFGLLAQTRVSPDLAGPLLGGNAQWVLVHLQAATPYVAEGAHALLVQLHGGRDLGRRPEDWSNWLMQLHGPKA